MSSLPLLPDLFAEQARTLAERVSLWPTVCIAEVWQQARPAQPGQAKPAYTRRLFGARDWPTLWPVVHRLGGDELARRPIAVTRHEVGGPRLRLMLQVIAMALPRPRLFALDGFLTRAQLDTATLPARLPLLNGYRRTPAQDWSLLRDLWQAHEPDGRALGLGLIVNGPRALAVQPVRTGGGMIDRAIWLQDYRSHGRIGSAARRLFDALPVTNEPQLVALATRAPVRPHSELNAGLIEMLRNRQKKDRSAPHASQQVKLDVTGDLAHPHPNRLVIVGAGRNGPG